MNRPHFDTAAERLIQQLLEERSCFERLVSNLSARFVNLPAEEIERQIEDGLRQVVGFLGVDRSSLLVFPSNSQPPIVLSSWAIEGFEPMRDMGVIYKLPWYLQKIRRGETLVYERLPDELPAEAVNEREYCVSQGSKSSIAIPIRIGGLHFGAMTIGSFRQYKTWPKELIPRLQLIAEIFANALARKRADEELRNSYNEIKELKDRLQAKGNHPRSPVRLFYGHEEIIGNGKAGRQTIPRPNELIATSVDEAFLKRAVTVVEKHLEDEAFSVEDLCREVGFSRVQFHRKIRALTNQPTTFFIRTIRLQRAASLLKQNAGTVSEIAYKVGFNSHPYFTKCFLECFGMTPAKYRKYYQGKKGVERSCHETIV